MISNELVSEVLGCNCINIHRNKSSLHIKTNNEGILINIYELANKCKEWAIGNDYAIYSSYGWRESSAQLVIGVGGNVLEMDTFVSRYEYEAIFKACEWVLKDLGSSDRETCDRCKYYDISNEYCSKLAENKGNKFGCVYWVCHI